MTGSDKAKIVADVEPEVETSSSSGRPLSWLHLCVIYGLLAIYGLWAATSYRLIRGSLQDELAISRRTSVVAGEVDLVRIDRDRHRVVDLDAHTDQSAAVRRRRSADEPPSGGPGVLGGVHEGRSLSRRTRQTIAVKRRPNSGRRRRTRDQKRRAHQSDTSDNTRRRRPAAGNSRRRHQSELTL